MWLSKYGTTRKVGKIRQKALIITCNTSSPTEEGHHNPKTQTAFSYNNEVCFLLTHAPHTWLGSGTRVPLLYGQPKTRP
jgi:hypothetical protein